MASLLTIKNALTVVGDKEAPAVPKPSLYSSRRITVSLLESAPSEEAVAVFEGLSKDCKRGLKTLGISGLFPVQSTCVPLIVDSYKSPSFLDFDLCVSVPTGQGKTLAYLLPIIECLTARKVPTLSALILVPTRDLAKQVASVVRTLCDACKKTDLTSLLVTGQDLFSKPAVVPDIVIATAGRFADYVACGNLDLSNLRWLVVDEADRMLSATSEADRWLKIVKSKVSEHCQRLLFSATMTRNPQKLESLGMRKPIFVACETEEESKASPATIQHGYLNCKDLKHKVVKLAKLLTTRKPRRCLIFTNSVERTGQLLLEISSLCPAEKFIFKEFDAKLEQSERDRILRDLKKHEKENVCFSLVCSDLATRGLDIANVDLVVNFDIPPFLTTYIHRVGRTGRAGKRGEAVSLVERKESDFFRRSVNDKLKAKFGSKIAKLSL